MKIRFQADADLNEDIIKGLLRRAPEIEFQRAETAGLRGLSDSQVLALCARDKRLLVSHDETIMPTHSGTFLAGAETSSGLLIVPQSLDVRSAIEELMMVWAASEAEEWIDRLARLPL